MSAESMLMCSLWGASCNLWATCSLRGSPHDVQWRSTITIANRTHWSSVFRKSKFLAYHILNFYKNHILPSRQFSNLITLTLQVVSMFGTTYCCEELFLIMKYTKSTLLSQVSDHHLSNFAVIVFNNYWIQRGSHLINCWWTFKMQDWKL